MPHSIFKCPKHKCPKKINKCPQKKKLRAPTINHYIVGEFCLWHGMVEKIDKNVLVYLAAIIHFFTFFTDFVFSSRIICLMCCDH